MRPTASSTELAHLYFIPKPHKIDTPLRPIVSSIKAAATGVSHFLDLLLRPIFDQAAKETTIINSIQFVRQIESYRDSGRLLPTTLFVTFDVANLYTMIPRDGAILALTDTFSHILPSSPIIEVACSLSLKQFTAATDGPKYVPPCQSRFSGKPIEKTIQREYDTIVGCFKAGLANSCVSGSDQRAKDFFASVDGLLRRLYTAPLSKKLFSRAQYEHRMIRSIQCQIEKSNVIVRPTDKSKVLHMGSADDYQRKAVQYMQETNAYREITSAINPCYENVRTVLTLIDTMLKNKDINLQLWKQYMRPTASSTELAHLYFIPKPHKVDSREELS
ncbi:unnamed protein product [Didymodactylos carnosus]|uniref:Reverse transcriptase domain-containing protein n=1 Tax=Didymodactylos carnosus TaxID=1234261 RepID=A0A815YCV8_9BILA|nr:unnamed protein product [Didymodactylos carnosus]CAF4431131.1 unnamed protein product [Didymodactylos carnosus]